MHETMDAFFSFAIWKKVLVGLLLVSVFIWGKVVVDDLGA